MIRPTYYRGITVLIIFSALIALAFHVVQLQAYFSDLYGIQRDGNFLYSLFTTKQAPAETDILFLGDVMLGRNVEYLSQLNGVNYSTSRIAGYLPEADAVVANFESAMAVSHTRTRAYTTQFTTANWMLPVLQTLNVTHASLANNHSLDFGVEGYNNAVKKLDEIEIEPFGHSALISSSSVVVIDGEVKIGMIGINTIFSTPNQFELQKQIDDLTQITDVQLAYIHWGEEYTNIHNEAQEKLAKTLIDMGIDAIIGHHPHVVQDIDVIDGALVFYSLGNFIFDQYFSNEVAEGYVLLMKASSSGELQFSLHPVTSVDFRSQPRPMTIEEKNMFLTNLANRSEGSLSEAILQNNLRSMTNLASTVEKSIITQ